MSLQTDAQIATKISTNVADNSAGLTTNEKLREVFNDLNNSKAHKAETQKTGLVLNFEERGVYGTPGAPEVGANITYDGLPGVLGCEVSVIHQAGAEPVYGPEFKKQNNSVAYDPAKLNFYTFKYVANNRMNFSISQDV